MAGQFSQRIDLTGQRFERWLVLGFSSIRRRGAYWLCRCDCGTERAVKGSALRGGQAKSCGCFKDENTRSRNYRHGHNARQKRSAEYQSWVGMLTRCENPKADNFPRYGGLGITVAKRWHTFADFLADILAEIGPRPKGKTLDRIDPAGHYEPGNVRWATAFEQRNNRRVKA